MLEDKGVVALMILNPGDGIVRLRDWWMGWILLDSVIYFLIDFSFSITFGEWMYW